MLGEVETLFIFIVNFYFKDVYLICYFQKFFRNIWVNINSWPQGREAISLTVQWLRHSYCFVVHHYIIFLPLRKNGEN